MRILLGKLHKEISIQSTGITSLVMLSDQSDSARRLQCFAEDSESKFALSLVLRVIDVINNGSRVKNVIKLMQSSQSQERAVPMKKAIVVGQFRVVSKTLLNGRTEGFGTLGGITGMAANRDLGRWRMLRWSRSMNPTPRRFQCLGLYFQNSGRGDFIHVSNEIK